MKIDSSAVGMESGRSYKASRTTFTRFSVTDYRGGLTQGNNTLNTQIGNEGDNGEGKAGESSQRAATTLEDWQARFQSSSARLSLRSTPMQTFETIRHRAISYILDLFFGNRKSAWDSWAKGSGMQSSSSQWQMIQSSSVNMKAINFFQGSYQYESEETFFSTTGTVRTADGREINFNINVGMSREFAQYYEEHVGMFAYQEVTDPLVINFDGDVADISDQTFYFDIDGDGVLDEINQLGIGSGFLALDKNGDGVINDGSELFGTASGNGFKDLAQYDADGNGWIDENDPIWDKLQIWCKDADGNDVLYKLSEKGVGAICLQNVGTQFTQQAQDGSAKGIIRNTGVFLYENGNVGTIQHVDMVKHSYSA